MSYNELKLIFLMEILYTFRLVSLLINLFAHLLLYLYIYLSFRAII